MLQFLKKHQSSLASVIIVMATIWITFLLWQDAEQIQQELKEIALFRLSGAIISALISILILASVFTIILRQVSRKDVTFSDVITPYLFGQIAKYLPGKVWGGIYQAQQMEAHVSTSCVWQTNIELQLISTIQHIIVILSILGLFFIPLHDTIFAFIFMESVFLLFLNSGYIHRGTLSVIHCFSPNAPVYAYINQQGGLFLAALILFLLLLEWFFIIITWQLLLPEGTLLLDTALIAASYIAAWLVGFFAFMVPNGIFVREAVFIWSGSMLGMDQGLLAYYGVLARIFFMFTDIIAAIGAYAFTSHIKKQKLRNGN